MKRILAAVDGSDGSMRAVELAVDLATKFRAELTLVDVVEHGEPPDWALAEYVRVDQIRNDMPRFAESFARDALAKAQMHAEARGVCQARSEVRFGDADHRDVRDAARA